MLMVNMEIHFDSGAHQCRKCVAVIMVIIGLALWTTEWWINSLLLDDGEVD